MTFDHGELNIPNRLRGLDAEITRNVAAELAWIKADDKARRAQFRADKAQAQALFVEIGVAMVAKTAPLVADKQGISTAKASRNVSRELDQMTKWEPAKFIALAERFKRQES